MDLMNPYDKPEVSQAFPWGLGVFFVIGIILLVTSIYLLSVKGSKRPIAEKIPDWAYTVAYPTFLLLLPFVMLLSTMLFFPCWWKNCP